MKSSKRKGQGLFLGDFNKKKEGKRDRGKLGIVLYRFYSCRELRGSGRKHT